MERLTSESPSDFCIRQGWAQYVYQMLVIDFLILNRDRHGANLEVLRSRTGKSYRLAPLFDQGLSLFCSILLDNAIKYAEGDRVIRVRLHREGKKVLFEAENNWAGNVDAKSLRSNTKDRWSNKSRSGIELHLFFMYNG